GLLAPVPVAARDVEAVLAVERDACAVAAGRRPLPTAAVVLRGHRGAVPILRDEDVLDVRERRAAVPTGAGDRERGQRAVVRMRLRVREIDEPVALELGVQRK